MKKDINDFLEEITNNFSELFVETFLLRYLSSFGKKELLGSIKVVQSKLNEKINEKFKEIKSK